MVLRHGDQGSACGDGCSSNAGVHGCCCRMVLAWWLDRRDDTLRGLMPTRGLL